MACLVGVEGVPTYLEGMIEVSCAHGSLAAELPITSEVCVQAACYHRQDTKAQQKALSL